MKRLRLCGKWIVGVLFLGSIWYVPTVDGSYSITLNRAGSIDWLVLVFEWITLGVAASLFFETVHYFRKGWL